MFYVPVPQLNVIIGFCGEVALGHQQFPHVLVEMTVTLHDMELTLGVLAYGKAVDLHYSRDQLIEVIQSDLGTLIRPRMLMQRSWLGTGSLTSFKIVETFGFPHGTGCLRTSIALRRICLTKLSDSSGFVNAFRYILFNRRRLVGHLTKGCTRTAQLHHKRIFTTVYPAQSSQDSESCKSLMGMIVREIDRDDIGKEERFDRITELVKLHYQSSY
ncbi:hypothetical protein M9H77_16404 [Catharanthus roseus]|uniref:Uncharacterized protein n=1 Tax=Catharanthus roseus TaxID=4058 RepID=A0ACC0B1P9_CATRO|nr:hypothetical protein M9H77_16404 [Catharanthus roseus]